MTTQPGNDGDPWSPAYPEPFPYSDGAPSGRPPQPPPRRSRRSAMVTLGIGAIAAATVVGVAVANGTTQSVNGTAIASSDGRSGSSSTPSAPTTIPGNGGLPVPGNGNLPVPGNGSSGGSSGGSAATSAQQAGVVDIYTVLSYQAAAAAGTGMVLTSDGEVLTNNHVIEGATSIKVTVVSTGRSYVAKVVGTAPTKDVAVLQLQNASGLQPANLGDSSTASVGDAVTAVGNAGGTGGAPSVASGKVTELGRTITASDENRTNSETLHGVIVTDAPIQSGDSGGPLYNARGQVIGMNTAASVTGTRIGFAIPINNALSVVAQIRKGIETSAIHIGYPGFLGIQLDQQTTRPLVDGVLGGGPAASAGITGGDVITKIGNLTIRTGTQLQKAVSSYEPGSQVSVTYTDPNTGSHTVTVTLATGPAD